MRAAALLALVLTLAGCLAPSPAALDASGLGSTVEQLSRVVHDTLVREPLLVESTVDGATLRVDVWRPEGEGPFPTILVLSPYWSFGGDAKTTDLPGWYIEYFGPRGYAVAYGEMRGTRASEGCWDFGGPLDRQDGHDIVEALAAQPWSNGKVGMLGQSHVGMSQVAAAVTAPPHLTTVVPIAAVTDWYRYLHKDGAPYVLNRATPPAYFAVHASPPTDLDPAGLLAQAQIACADNAVHLAQSADLDGDKDAYWQDRDLIALAGNVNASVFLVHGFLDENVKTDHFLDLWNALPPHVVKKAWYGQWFHEHPPYVEWREQLHAWFDFWLLGIDNGVLDGPRVVVQDNTQAARVEADWPPAATNAARWMLDGDALAPEAPGETTGDASYAAVPGDDRGGPHPPVVHEAAFASAPLEAPLRIVGEPTLELEGILDHTNGRWIAVLFDVAPDGSRDEITRAYLDARHREDLAAPKDVTPGEATAYTLRFFPRDHVVQAGHALHLVFEGGDMGCARDLRGEATCEGTGILPLERVVTHTVLTGPGSATRLVLPLAPVEGAVFALTDLDAWLDDVPP